MGERSNEYVNRMVGTPWVKGADDPERDGGLDCWGAVHDSYKCIDEIILPTPSNREECDFSKSMDISGLFEPIDGAMEGAVFGCYNSDGVMIHIGRILAGRAYHSVGTEENPRNVCTWSLHQLERHYQRLSCTVEYYLYVGK